MNQYGHSKQKTDPGPDDSVTILTGPGEGPMSPGWNIGGALYQDDAIRIQRAQRNIATV